MSVFFLGNRQKAKGKREQGIGNRQQGIIRVRFFGGIRGRWWCGCAGNRCPREDPQR